MRVLISSLVLAFSFSAFTQTVEEAKDLYAKRGADVQNAQKAADMFIKLAEKAETKLEKAKMYDDASLSYYFLGTQAEKAGDKMELFNEGIGLAIKATKEIEETAATEEEKRELAISYYRYGSNLGKWAEANGVTSSLSKWSNLKSTMLYIIGMGYADIEDYGPNRILGRAYYKLPAPLGSKKKSYTYLNEGFEKTLNGKVSINGLNNLFYADLLIATGYSDDAKVILKDFIAVDAATFNPKRIPETMKEIEEAKAKLKTLE